MASRRRSGKGYRMEWRGQVVAAKVKQAAVIGINETLAACVILAKSSHPGWQNRTGTAEGSIRITSMAAFEGAHIVGRWGSEGVEYMRYLEYLHGAALRSAADVEYRELQERIRRRVK